MHARSHTARSLRLIAVWILLVPVWSFRAAAQGQSAAHSASKQRLVVVLGVEGADSIGRGRVLLRGRGKEAAVIMVPLTAQPSDLAEAFKIVHQMRPRVATLDGGVVQRIDLNPVASRRTLSAAEQAAYTRYIRKFETGPLVTIPGAGRGRSVHVELRN
jgi:hypothetical protein